MNNDGQFCDVYHERTKDRVSKTTKNALIRIMSPRWLYIWKKIRFARTKDIVEWILFTGLIKSMIKSLY
jgi:hypothetical protein